MRTILCLAAAGIAAASALASQDVAAADYSEAIDGDLSNIPATPTLWTLSAGANALTGSAGTTGVTSDYDILSFTIPENHQLDSITINNWEDDSAAFVGLQAGTPWLDNVGSAMRGDNLLSYVLIGYGSFPPDLLAAWRAGSGNPPSLDVPLASGVYTMEMQDIDTPFNYALAFNVSALSGPMPGDFNGDGTVDAADLAQWQADYGASAGSDADGDGDTDGDDFLVWQRNLSTPAGAVAVPEPAALALVAMGGAALLSAGRFLRSRCVVLISTPCSLRYPLGDRRRENHGRVKRAIRGRRPNPA